jgi:hypothetical protein
MIAHPPYPRVVHRLPPAPHFVGREEELAELRGYWMTGFRGVLALVGLGGAGKTAIAARFLDELLGSNHLARPDGLFVWSFYQEPDAGLFLQEAYNYFTAGNSTTTPAKGAGLLHLLRDALAAGGPHLLLLDGLERVQQPGRTPTDVFGQVEDPLLKGLLTRIAEGMGHTTVLVTSRFPLTDLQPFQGQGYRHLDVGGLSLPAAVALLRSRGVHGDEDTLVHLIETYGAHALTLDHLGGLIGQFLDGDPRRAPDLPAVTTPGVGRISNPSYSDRQALRLARLLRAYEEHLPPVELALLCRLCLLRRSVSEAQIAQLFLCSPAVHARTVRELGDMLESLPGAPHAPEDDWLDLTESIGTTILEALCTSPIAGPKEAFLQEIRLVAEKGLEQSQTASACDFAEIVRLYAGTALDQPTDELPLRPEERRRLGSLYQRYTALREHPLITPKAPPSQLEQLWKVLSKPSKPAYHPGEDLSPHDLERAFRKVQKRLQHFTYKHFALRRVRELCRLYQQKWTLAGPLATLNAADLHKVLASLVERHLVLREADGSFSVHPAVRDHFTGLAKASEQASWHDLLREQLVSLIQRPGVRRPEDRATLDLAEEAIYHALQAGRTDWAVAIYQEQLGGLRHLGWKLGEMNRGLRILREFNPCPDRWALAWYRRALGDLEEAYRHNGLPSFRADIRLLQGRLPQVAKEGDSARTALAAFLMGQGKELPPDPFGCVIPRDQIWLYRGPLPDGRHSALHERFYHDIGWEGDRVRCQLLQAEVARRQADLARCREYLELASGWILHSGSVEHLCLLHLVRARVARTVGDGEAAQCAVHEGLHLARQCGLGLYHIELLCEQAEICLARADSPVAEQVAGEALERASAADCQFVWGAAEAGHLLGQSLMAQRRFPEARAVLNRALELRQRIGDPKIRQTEQLLAILRS